MEANKKQIILMHKEVEVARAVDGEIGGEWVVRADELLPTGMCLQSISETLKVVKSRIDRKYKIEDGENTDFNWQAINVSYFSELMSEQISAASKVRENNYREIQKWLAYRILPLDRMNAKKIHQALGLNQSQSEFDKAKIAMNISGLSILDNYWVTYEGSDKTWESVDIRRRSLSQGLAVLALTGNSLTLTAQELEEPLNTAAELTAHGAYPKGIFRENDELYMYKSGKRYTVAAEIAVSKILECSNVYGYVDYSYDDKRYGLPCSKCKLLTTSDRDLVPAITYPGNSVAYAMNNFRQQLAQMCVVDYIVANTDRHMQNWGYFRESPTWNITGLQYLYDHNNAFDENELRGDNIANSVLDYADTCIKPTGLFDAAKRMYKYSGFKFTRVIPKSAFKYFGDKREYIIESFKNRCGLLGIEVCVR